MRKNSVEIITNGILRSLQAILRGYTFKLESEDKSSQEFEIENVKFLYVPICMYVYLCTKPFSLLQCTFQVKYKL